jgi:hypothetical protein
MNINSDLRHADRANNFVRAIVTLASKTNEKEIRFYIGGRVENLVYTVRCPSNTVMMMDRQCSGIDSLPGWKSTKGNPIRMKHEVKNCTGVFSVICDIYQNKDKTLTFEDVVGAVRKAFKSNAHPKRTFELVIDQAVLATIPFAADILAQNEIIFEKWFAELVAYEGKHGNCNVSTVTGEDNKLGVWLSNMRHTYKKKQAGDIDPDGRILTEDQIVQLEALGVQWSLQATFEEHFEELRAFNDEHGRCPSIDADEGHRQLYVWLCNTRVAYKDGKSSKRKLSDGQRKLFATIGLALSFEEQFAENLDLLRAFKAENGERFPTKKNKDYKKLFNWVVNMRKISKKKQDGKPSTTMLTDEQITQFERIGLANKWSEAEVTALTTGYKLHGKNWSKIKSQFSDALQLRSNVQIRVRIVNEDGLLVLYSLLILINCCFLSLIG